MLSLLGAQPGFVLTLAHRSQDPAPQSPCQHNFFTFTEQSLTGIDVVWLIGGGGPNIDGSYNRPGGNDPCTAIDSYPLQESEVAALTTFMSNGGGVMAVGDHAAMGASMGNMLPRIREMRNWTSPPSPPPSGAGRISTVQASPDDTANYPGTVAAGLTFTPNLPGGAPTGVLNVALEDQSDDIPAPVTPITYYKGPAWGGGTYWTHPILTLPDGTWVSALPDHMHEGSVPNLDAAHWTGADWPTSSTGIQPTPSTIASGVALEEVYHPEYQGEGGFETDYSDPKAFWGYIYGVIGAYDGRPAQAGRIVTHSTFHHFYDINLIGDRDCLPTDPRSQGFLASATGQAFLTRHDAYIVGMTRWLARPEKLLLGLHANLINATYNRHLSEAIGAFVATSNPTNTARRSLGQDVAAAMSRAGWSKALILDALLASSSSTLLPPSFTGQRGTGLVLPPAAADEFVFHALGAAVAAAHTHGIENNHTNWPQATATLTNAIGEGFRRAADITSTNPAVAEIARVLTPPSSDR